MAGELGASVSFTYAKGSSAAEMRSGLLKIDVAGTNFIHHRQTIGFAAEEALVLGEVATLGWAVFINRDATNFVEIRPATGAVDLIKLKPLEVAAFRFADGVTAPFAQANTADCEVEYIILED